MMGGGLCGHVAESSTVGVFALNCHNIWGLHREGGEEKWGLGISLGDSDSSEVPPS